MSNKERPQYADQKGAIQLGFDGNILIAEKQFLPTNGTSGYAPGCILFIRGVSGDIARYSNLGTALSCNFALGTGISSRLGLAAVTGTLDVVTGLTIVTTVIVTLQEDANLNGMWVTATIGNQSGAPASGSIRISVWKPTSSGDVTPIPSIVAKNIQWFAAGT